MLMLDWNIISASTTPIRVSGNEVIERQRLPLLNSVNLL